MVYITVAEFLAQADAISRPSREEENALIARAGAGDTAARDTLVRGYLPFAASFLRRAPSRARTLRAVYACISAVKACVDRYASHGRDTLVRQLGRSLRQRMVTCIAEQ